MAYIKVKWRKVVSGNQGLSASEYEKYLLKERGSEIIVTSNDCIEQQVIDQFIYTQNRFGQYQQSHHRSDNIAFEVIQSFSPDESKTLPGSKVNDMGVELAKRYFPDHEFMVVTHTNTDKLHNHILVNPVNQVTGKRDVTDKKKHLYNLRSISNDVSRENGLSIIRETDQSREMKLPQKVIEMNRRGAKSRRMDLFQKADLARNYATSFDEYVASLDVFQIKVAITEKNITYFYGDTQKGVRGQKLGKAYDKEGLINQFKLNDVKFADRPNLKRKSGDEISAFKEGKDYSRYTKSERRGERTPVKSIDQLSDTIIPHTELKKAQNSDILEYCEKHKIKTYLNDKGQRALLGRDHVVIDGNHWKNTKNKTVGSLIEFVAFKDDISFLAAVSKITGNKNLMLLEQYDTPVKKTYTSFHIPKEKDVNIQFATDKVSNFLKQSGINSEVTKDLFKLKKVQVDKKGSIWLFAEDNRKGALEYSFGNNESYQSKVHGDVFSPFHVAKGTGSSVAIFTDPLHFLKTRGANSFKQNCSKSDLVLFTPHEKSVDLFLAQNPQIKSVNVVEHSNHKATPDILNFTNRLKQKYHAYSVAVEMISFTNMQKEHLRSINFNF